MAIVNTIPVAVFLSGNLLSVVHELFAEANSNLQTCKMPFQGSYRFSETNFQDFSRTFPGLRLIFQGL